MQTRASSLQTRAAFANAQHDEQAQFSCGAHLRTPDRRPRLRAQSYDSRERICKFVGPRLQIQSNRVCKRVGLRASRSLASDAVARNRAGCARRVCKVEHGPFANLAGMNTRRCACATTTMGRLALRSPQSTDRAWSAIGRESSARSAISERKHARGAVSMRNLGADGQTLAVLRVTMHAVFSAGISRACMCM